MQWVGWIRLREGLPWKRACQGDTLGECARRPNAATRSLKIKDVNTIMTGGRYPQVGAPPDTQGSKRRPNPRKRPRQTL